ncbi:MAG: hypothetical protein M3N48_07140 [Verrucomicrobiota bacterium]|nr:hypothetical protein [Verrucomicrobiota bacterium]
MTHGGNFVRMVCVIIVSLGAMARSTFADARDYTSGVSQSVSAANAVCPLSMTIQTGRGFCTNGTIGPTFTSVGTSTVFFTVAYQSVQGAGNPTLSIQDNTGTFQTSSGTINGTGGPVSFSINQSSQTFTLTPGNSNIANAAVKVKASDGSSTATQTFTFWTGPAPRPTSSPSRSSKAPGRSTSSP